VKKETLMVEATPPPAATFNEGYVEADGFRIRYVEAGQGSPVVMLDCTNWGLSKLRDTLAQKYHVIVFEPPGFGSSPANTRSQSVKELANTMSQAAAKMAPNQHTLIGASFGANVALWQTLQSPDQVEALILISPTAVLPLADPTVEATERIAKRLFAHPEKATGLLSVDPAIVAQEQALAQRLKSAAHDAEVESRLKEIRCPTLVVFGSKDQMVAPEAARTYRAKIPNCNVSIVYDAGHIIAADRPEALINAVADYVERRETFIVGRQNSMINP
jgi:pimeloyl-ACP methyl ester carboxylesterase